MTTTHPAHFFVGCTGELCDTRPPDWHKRPATRENYARHHRNIRTGQDLRACLRAGDAAWPGGYGIFYITDDGAALCPDCVRAELRSITDSIRHKCSDGWRVVACDCLANCDEAPTCEHCNKEIR